MASNGAEKKKNKKIPIPKPKPQPQPKPPKPVYLDKNTQYQSMDTNDTATLKLLLKKAVVVSNVSDWDPLLSYDWDNAGAPGPLAGTRIKRDIAALYKDPLPGIFIMPSDANLSLVYCLIVGPFDTPYEGGFFRFAVRFGPSYPLHPPRVKLLSTDAGRVRFNPNLYSNGKVCLSILGTWSGPAWSPASNLGSLLLSIQSLMNDNPYFNEPGFKVEQCKGESQNYNYFIAHETIRYAVCSQMETVLHPAIMAGKDFGDTKTLPEELGTVMKSAFLEFYDHYVEVCNKHLHLDGQEMKDLLFTCPLKGKFDFASLLKRLQMIKEDLLELPENSDENCANGRDTPLSSMSENSDDCASSSNVNRESTRPSSSEIKNTQGNSLISEANEYAVGDEEGTSFNDNSSQVDDASGTSSSSGLAAQLSNQFCDQWFFEDNDYDDDGDDDDDDRNN